MVGGSGYAVNVMLKPGILFGCRVLAERSASVGEVRSEADFGVGEALYRKAHKEKNLPAELITLAFWCASADTSARLSFPDTALGRLPKNSK